MNQNGVIPMDNKIFQMNKTFVLMLLIVSGVAFATTVCTGTPSASDRLKCAMISVCNLVEGLLPVMAFVLFILAGVAYAVGNFFGAEMRAKAVGYAMNMLTGAIIALILSIIGPTIISSLGGAGFTKCSDI